MTTDFSKHLDLKWTLGQAIEAAKYTRGAIKFESDDLTFVVIGASFDPGEAPSMYSPGSPACVEWAEGAGVYILGDVAGRPALWKLSAEGDRLFDKEHENKLIALLVRDDRDRREDFQAALAEKDGPLNING